MERIVGVVVLMMKASLTAYLFRGDVVEALIETVFQVDSFALKAASAVLISVSL